MATYPLNVCYDSCTIFKPSVGKFELRSLLCKDLANEATDPAAAPKDEEDLPKLITFLHCLGKRVVYTIRIAQGYNVPGLKSSVGSVPQ